MGSFRQEVYLPFMFLQRFIFLRCLGWVLVSTYTVTQQQAMLISFFMMMIFILLGGLYTSIDSMPEWAQMITRFNPVSYFIEVMRMVVLKGSSLGDIKNHLLTMFGFAVFLNGWAIINYRKRSDFCLLFSI